MIGIGLQRAGITGAGLGEASRASPSPTPGQGAPFLTSEGNYVIDPVTGDVARTTESRHRVALALQTIETSATADISLGETKPTKIGTSTALEAYASTKRALKDIVDDGVISVDRVSVDVLNHSPGTVKRSVEYTDLLQKATDKAVR